MSSTRADTNLNFRTLIQRFTLVIAEKDLPFKTAYIGRFLGNGENAYRNLNTT
jgi:hypothetical protein